jgi:hypothetical protein
MTPRHAACLVVLLIFAFAAYRAAKAPITTDEAYTYTDSVARPAVALFNHYNANHHVLHTLLCKAAVSVFPLTEFTLRLPALLGALLVLSALFALYRDALGEVWLLPIAIAFTALHPGVFDYLSLARGYGLALGFWLWGMRALFRGQLSLAGALLGLSIAANGVLVVPVLAAIAAAAIGNLIEVVCKTLVPALVLAFVVVILPLAFATESTFYFGVPTLLESARSFTEIPGHPLLSELGLVLAPLILAAALWREWPEGRTAAFTLLLLIGMHVFGGMPYPKDRTGIYWIPLLAIAGFRLLEEVRVHERLFAGISLFILFCVVAFARSVEPRVFRQWTPDASNRSISRRLHGTVAAAWPLPPSLQFYRSRYHLENQYSVETWTPGTQAGTWLIYAWDPKPLAEGFHEIWRDERASVVAYQR